MRRFVLSLVGEADYPLCRFKRWCEAGYRTNDNISDRGVNGYRWSSSLWDGGTYRGTRYLDFHLDNADVNHNQDFDLRLPLRLVRVQE